MNISAGMLCESRPAAAEYEEMKDGGGQQRQVRWCGPTKKTGADVDHMALTHISGPIFMQRHRRQVCDVLWLKKLRFESK